MLAYSQMRQMPRLAIDGQDFINPGMQSNRGGVPGMQGFGQDFLYPTSDRVRPQMLGPNGSGGPIAGMPTAGGGMNVGPNYPASSIPPAVQPPMQVPGVNGLGNDMFYAGGRGPNGMGTTPAAAPGLFWDPTTAAPTTAAQKVPYNGGRPGGGGVHGPLLPGNSAPNYQSGNGLSLEPGQWHNPGYLSSNGTMWNGSQPGSWNNPGYVSQGMGQSGGMAGGGGGGSPFADYLNRYQSMLDKANAANEARYQQGLQGYSAIRNRANDLLNGLGNQQRIDTNQIFDNRQSGLTQDMISRGLTNSTVQDNQRVGIDSQRANAIGRLNEDLTNQRLQTELPLAEQQIQWIGNKVDQQPDLGMMSQLMQQAAAGGYGAPQQAQFVDMNNMDYGYGGGSPFMPGGYGGYRQGGSQLRRGGGIRGGGSGSGASGLMGSTGGEYDPFASGDPTIIPGDPNYGIPGFNETGATPTIPPPSGMYFRGARPTGMYFRAPYSWPQMTNQ